MIAFLNRNRGDVCALGSSRLSLPGKAEKDVSRQIRTLLVLNEYWNLRDRKAGKERKEKTKNGI
jgi:hypothetical protein